MRDFLGFNTTTAKRCLCRFTEYVYLESHSGNFNRIYQLWRTNY